MLLGRRAVEAGLRGGMSVPLVRPRASASYVCICVCCSGSRSGAFSAGSGFSSTGESGGGGMSVPSVRENDTGVNCGSWKRLFVLPFVFVGGIFRVFAALSLSVEWKSADAARFIRGWLE